MSNENAPIGPVDVAVMLFPDAELSRDVSAALADTIAAGAVRLLDALIVQKSATGDVTIIDADEGGEVITVLSSLSDHEGLLGEEDAQLVAEELPPQSSAMVVAWENIWAVGLRSAISRAGGEVVAHERIDADSVVAAHAASADNEGRS